MTNEEHIRIQCADLANLSDQLSALHVEEAKLMVKIVAARGLFREALIKLLALNPPEHMVDYVKKVLDVTGLGMKGTA